MGQTQYRWNGEVVPFYRARELWRGGKTVEMRRPGKRNWRRLRMSGPMQDENGIYVEVYEAEIDHREELVLEYL